MKMFSFKKKSTAPTPVVQASIDDSAIHVMPNRYYRVVKPGLSHQTKIILWSSLVIVLLAVSAVASWWYLRPSPALPAVSDETVTTTPPPTTNSQTNSTTSEATQPAISETTDLTTPTPAAAPTLTGLLPDSLDTDKDGLTDNEEKIYGSGLNRPDTDRDTYLDGQELINGYDPLIAGSARLESATTVVKYVSKLQKYQFLQPRSWTLTASDTEGRQMKLQADSGESFEIVVFDNADKLSLQVWFDKFAGQKVGRLIAKANRPEMIMTADELTVYFMSTDQTRVVAVDYNAPKELTALNFRSTFKMIYGSFEFLP